MTSVAPKPDSEELFGRTHPPETAADLGERISPSASRSKTIVADSAVPGGSLEETQPGEEEKMGDAKQTALESPQEHEIAEALFDLANTADAAGHSPREGRGESDAPEEAEPASSSGGLVQSRKRPRKPNRNLDAYQGFHDDDTDDIEMERAPPRKSWTSRESAQVAAPEGPTPEPVPSHIPSGGRRNPPGGRGGLSDLDGKACMRHVHIARRILAAQGGKKPASRTAAAPRAPSSFVPQPSGGAPPGLPQGLGISVGGPGVGPAVPPGSLRGGWRQDDARATLEAHLAARLGLSGPRQLEQVLSSLPPNSLGALAGLLSRQQQPGGAGQVPTAALRGLDQRGYPGYAGPQGHGAAPYGYVNQNAPAHGPPPGGLRGAPGGGLPELLAQVLAQQQHGGLHSMAPQRGPAYNGPAPPPGVSPAAARLQQLYASHAGQQGAGAGFGGNDLRQREQQHSGPDVASVLRTLQGLQHGGGVPGAAAALQRPPQHHHQYGAGPAEADASRQGQLVQLAKLVQAALAGGGAPRGGGAPPTGRWAPGAPPSQSVGQQQVPGGPPLPRETNPVAAVAAAYVAARQQQQQQGNAAAPPGASRGTGSQQAINGNGTQQQQSGRASSQQQQLFSRGDSAAQLAALFAAQQQQHLTRRPSGGTTTSQSLGGASGAALEGSAPTGSMREVTAPVVDTQQQRSNRSTPELVINPPRGPQLDLDESHPAVLAPGVAVPKPEVVDDNEQTSSEATMPLGGGGAGKRESADNDVAEGSATSAAANDKFDAVPKSENLLDAPVLLSSGGEEAASVHPNGTSLGQSESVLAAVRDQSLIKSPIDVKIEGSSIPASGEPALSSNGGAAIPEDSSIVLPSAGSAPPVDLARLLASVQGRVNTPQVQDLLRQVLAQLEGR